jgi:hypothetical protein
MASQPQWNCGPTTLGSHTFPCIELPPFSAISCLLSPFSFCRDAKVTTMMPLRALLASACSSSLSSSSSVRMWPACSRAVRGLSTRTEDEEERSHEAGSSQLGGRSKEQNAEHMIRSVARSTLAAEVRCSAGHACSMKAQAWPALPSPIAHTRAASAFASP